MLKCGIHLLSTPIWYISICVDVCITCRTCSVFIFIEQSHGNCTWKSRVLASRISTWVPFAHAIELETKRSTIQLLYMNKLPFNNNINLVADWTLRVDQRTNQTDWNTNIVKPNISLRILSIKSDEDSMGISNSFSQAIRIGVVVCLFLVNNSWTKISNYFFVEKKNKIQIKLIIQVFYHTEV